MLKTNGEPEAAARPLTNRVLLIMNAHARRGLTQRETVLRALEADGFEVEMVPAESEDTMREAMESRRDKVDAVIVGGGDGTLITSVAGVRASGLPLLILPLGTVNELARTLEIPFDVKAACALLREGSRRTIDVGVVNGKYFLNEASVGISTHIAQTQTTDVKRRWGPLAIVITTLRALPYTRPFNVDVTSPDGPDANFSMRTVQLTIANSYRFGTVFENKDATLDDGTLDLYSVIIDKWRKMWPVLGCVMRGKFHDVPGLKTVRAKQFTVRTKRPRQIFADGEPAAYTPAEFSVLKNAIDVIVPAAHVS